MKCIFCEEESSNSKSIEHILPESLGNTVATLKKGIVCDKCNNYFARKVEGPYLNRPEVKRLRQECAVKNKRGNTIELYDYPTQGIQIREISLGKKYFVCANCKMMEKEVQGEIEKFIDYQRATDVELLNNNYEMSRLLAKVAVEMFVYSCGSTDQVCQYVMEDEFFSRIRKYARYGSNIIWSYHARRIYGKYEEPNERCIFDNVNWESDFLFTKDGEVFLIIAIYGIEYAFNLLLPNIEGYKKWLIDNDYKSILYMTKEERKANFLQYGETHFKLGNWSEEDYINYTKD